MARDSGAAVGWASLIGKEITLIESCYFQGTVPGARYMETPGMQTLPPRTSQSLGKHRNSKQLEFGLATALSSVFSLLPHLRVLGGKIKCLNKLFGLPEPGEPEFSCQDDSGQLATNQYIKQRNKSGVSMCARVQALPGAPRMARSTREP